MEGHGRSRRRHGEVGVKVNRALLTGLSGRRGGAERERKIFRRKIERERTRGESEREIVASEQYS